MTYSSSGSFPSDFQWGVATSAFQIEGAASEDGRGPSIWDTFAARPGRSSRDTRRRGLRPLPPLRRRPGPDRRAGRERLPLLDRLAARAAHGGGAGTRRAWTSTTAWSTACCARGIEPHLTLYHWDLPQALQDEGGWARRDTVTASPTTRREVARRLGDRVATHRHLNEPWSSRTLGYEKGMFAPGAQGPAAGDAGVAPPAAGARPRGAGACAPRRARCQLGIVLNQSPGVPGDRPGRRPAAKARLRRRPLGRAGTWTRCSAAATRPTCSSTSARTRRLVRPANATSSASRIDFLGINYYTRDFVARRGPAAAGLPSAQGYRHGLGGLPRRASPSCWCG